MSDICVNDHSNIAVKGIAVAVSTTWRPLEDVVKRYGIEDGFNLKKFKANTGVSGRYEAGEEQLTSDFCCCAAERLISAHKIEKDEIGAIVFVSQMPDYVQPATACVLHKRLGLSKGCMAFDVNLGCSGFVYGLNIVSSLLTAMREKKYALLLCGDTSAKNKYRGRKEQRDSHSTLLLFGDSGSATLLSKEEGAEPLSIMSCTDGEGFDAIMMTQDTWRHPFSTRSYDLDDVRVFNFSITEAPKMINAYMRMQGTSPADYDALVLHQANRFIMQTIGKRTGFPKEKVLSSIEKFSNTSSASIPVTIVNEWGGDAGDRSLRLMCCGFGVGLSWAAVELHIASKDIMPLIHTDDFFEDGIPDE